MALFGMAAKAPGVVYNIVGQAWDPTVLLDHVLDAGFAWLALLDADPSADSSDFGGYVSTANPRSHPEIATSARAAGLLFGIVPITSQDTGSSVHPWTNASCQASVDYWSPDFVLYRGIDGYWPSTTWNADELDVASFTAANPTVHLAILTGNVRGDWAYAAGGTGAYGQNEGPAWKARLQAFATAGWQVVCDPNGGATRTTLPTSANTIAAAEALGWAADDIGISYYNTPGRYPGWGNPADQAATAGQWAATDVWPPDEYDYAWCMADGWFHGRLP